MTDLWVEKYRPKTLNEYVFQNSNQQQLFIDWVKEKSIPHLLFTGPAGTGKTTAAKMLINELKLHPYDVLEINASNDAKVEFMREKIVSFASTRPFGHLKIVLLDEADYLSPTSQAVLRGIIEQYHESTRFILTGNYPNKIIPALHSRCLGIHIEKLDHTEFTARAATILVEEKILFEIECLDTFVKSCYPDMRKCINQLQINSQSGTLLPPTIESHASSDYLTVAVDLIKNQNIRDARKVICENIRPDEVEGTFRWMYDNLDLWSDNEEGQDQAILIIRKALVNSTLVADQEINLSACLVELGSIVS
jgi:DNA polymerase III delta prime subunit